MIAADGPVHVDVSVLVTVRHYPELPVMMVTAYGDDERRRRAEELGAAEFLTKRVDFDLLKVRLRQLPKAAD
jgi:DNA-binding response OmpR family regulator